MKSQIMTGSFTGTGATANVPLGWTPDYVKIFNPNDAGALDPTLEWWSGMGAGKALKSLRITDNGATGLKSQQLITTLGISAYAGSTTAANGFTIGADTDLNVVGEVCYWVAMRNGQ
jgi:hypothetical protein